MVLYTRSVDMPHPLPLVYILHFFNGIPLRQFAPRRFYLGTSYLYGLTLQGGKTSLQPRALSTSARLFDRGGIGITA